MIVSKESICMIEFQYELAILFLEHPFYLNNWQISVVI